MKIAHTADIHIRALSRHDEYRQSFQNFIDDCRSQGVDHIFVGGDIFHTKTTGISPEYIDLLTWWLTAMAEVAPVHMILGNHDGNLVNMSRQDAVSPIVDALNNPRVHLYKKSGVYPIQQGYNLCVFSLFDEEGWSRVSPVEGEVNIAAYHGPVWGSKTESDWAVEDGLRVDFFDPYPFTLLGDIHKRQDLAFRGGKPVMAYPGTLIQQNYAEELDHGYLIWNIESISEWSVSFRKLPNQKPFVTLQWQDDVERTIEDARNYPKSSRFRIKSKLQIPQNEVHRLTESLKTTMSASEVTYKSDQQIDKQSIATGSAKLIKSDLRSPDVLVKLLADYHGDDKIHDSDLDTITSQVKSYLSSISSSEDVARGSSWSLRHLKWDNMFVYGEGNVIDFEKISGIVGIFGANRTGKSSIVGTLMYSLFNTTDRGPMKNIYVCNVRKPYCSSTAVISHNSRTYVIERQTTKSANKKGQVSASTSLNLYRMRDDGELDDLCGEQRNDTEKTIRSLIGNSDDFLMTSLSAQGETNQFISQGSSKRRSILSRFLDLDVFDKIYELANKDLGSLKSQLRNFPERNWEEAREVNETTCKNLDNQITNLTTDIERAQSSLSVLRADLSMLNARPVTREDLEVHRSNVDRLEKNSDELKKHLETCGENLQDLQKKLYAVEDYLDKSDIVSLKEKLASLRKLESAFVDLRHSNEREETLLSQQKKSLKILDEVPCGDEYSSCKFIKDAHLVKTKIESQQEKVGKIAASLREVEQSLSVIKDTSLEDKINKHVKAVELSSKLKLEIAKKESDLEKTSSSLQLVNSEAEDARVTLRDLEKAIANDENVTVVKTRSKIEELQRSIRAWDDKKTASIDARGKIKAKMEHLEEEKNNRDKLLSQMKVQELISSAFSKKGVPLEVAKSQLPMINDEISKILQGIVDFTIELEADEDSDSLEIYINYGDSRRVIELCSGMEKTISSIAIRVALANVSSLPKPDIFIIDEGFGTLDSSGVEACNRLLVSLKRHFRTVIVITHVDGIKDSADHIIEIARNEKDSRVEFLC